MMASKTGVKGYLSVNNSCFEVQLISIKNYPGELTIIIESVDKQRYETYCISDSNVEGIDPKDDEWKIIINRGNLPQLNVTFMSNAAYTKALNMLKDITRIRRYHGLLAVPRKSKCDPNQNGVPALWRVEYNLDGSAQLPEEGDELKAMFKIIEKHHPPNTAIVNVHRSTNAIIDYGVYCECEPLNFEETVQRPGQLPGATLLENVANMKIAEEEKACQD